MTSMKKLPKYKFYPSLLDKFQQYIDLDYENYWLMDTSGRWHKNYDESTGEYILPADKLEEHAKKELIMAINREGTDISMAADKGSVFNEIVDCIIMKKKSIRSDISILSSKSYYIDKSEITHPCIYGKMHDFEFVFDKTLCTQAANYFKDSLCQVYTDGILGTSYGDVLLYGYIDYLREDKVYDAKTTKHYEFGKFQNYWQKHVYPYTLIESGKCTNIASFEYSVFLLKGGTDKQPLISGSFYPEVYVYDHDDSRKRLRYICEHFIEFLQENKSLIKDRKIFGE